MVTGVAAGGVAKSRVGLPSVDVAALRATRLERTWFARDALVVARALIGCFVVHEAARGRGRPRVSRIVETEAYRGPRDLASHSRAGLTRRTRALFGPAGHAYVFFVYGMHECFNVTCGGAGRGHAVLIRAGEPTAGFDERHEPSGEPVRLDGPGRFARGMGLTRSHDGQDLVEPPIYLCGRASRPRIARSARVGVAYAGTWADRLWRFYDPSSRHVSKPPRKAIGRVVVP
jgi:DNA-3-methyladenine glycosylase